MRIIITGGHFSPAYSIIQRIKKDNDILVIGRKHAFEGDKNETYEYRLCVDEKIPFKNLNAGRLQRKFTRYTIRAALKSPQGIISALSILTKFKPDVVLTFGGYIGLAVSLAAFILRIPVVLHEQTQRAGLSSRIIGRFASIVLISFNTSRDYFNNKNIVLTGNPIREKLFQKGEIPELSSDLPIIYITGGSTGANALNQTFFEIIPELVKEFKIIHQTGNNSQYSGDRKAEEIKEKLPKIFYDNYIPRPFFSPDEVAFLFQNAALVVSRSGINTVLELMALGTPALLVPLPAGQLNEQKDNAVLFEKVGLGKYLEQKDLTPERLKVTLHAMIKERDTYTKNAPAALKFIYPDAAENIVEILSKYGRGEKGKKGNT